MNKKVIILLCLFILSRLVFINPLPVFFDSPEYLMRFANPNYFQAIISGHLPFHVGYITLFWPVFQIAKLLGINPSFAVVFAQIIFSTVSIYCFYRFVEIISNRNVAIFSTIIASLFPLYWITNVTIMTESTYINFLLISAFFLSLYAKTENNRNIFLLLGSLSFGISLLTNPLVLIWLPFLLSLTYLINKGRIIKVIFTLLITVGVVTPINWSFVFNSFQNSTVFPKISSALDILRFIRNAFLPIFQNNTSLVFILSVVSLIKLFIKNKGLCFVLFSWLIPLVLASQWFNPLLSGRHSIIADFGFAFLIAILLQKRKVLFFVVIFYILITYLPALNLLKQPVPYLIEKDYVKKLPKGLLIETHLAKPQVERQYSGQIIFVNQPGWNKNALENTIDSHLNIRKPVFITSQALSDPYGLYSGPFLLPLSLSYAKKFELDSIIRNYSLKKFASIDEEAGLSVYKIVSKQKSKYPDIPRLNYNRRRMDYFDPITQLLLLIERAMTTQSHNMIEG